ncbi:hypothetical protein [Rickettsia endosymbiont of Pantilius tunicatus]|uniref:hypothetical protein n=1 Tax=Rickettsia endosymbiont of Pantilius tunicatus TaxID=3066267 RepID=UPI0030E52A29
MIEYDPKDIGLKVVEIYPDVQKVLSLFIIPEQKQYLINYVQSKILECMPKKDVITAIATVNCVLGTVEISPQEFNLSFIEPIAQQNDYTDFAVSFLGLCDAFTK